MANNTLGSKVGTFSIYTAVVFLASIMVAYYLGHISQVIVLGYLILSVLTFFVYAFDKHKAKRGHWRIKEKTLHILGAVGGWPGALIAQQVLRHKSIKTKFKMVFWLTVLINLAGFYWYRFMTFNPPF